MILETNKDGIKWITRYEGNSNNNTKSVDKVAITRFDSIELAKSQYGSGQVIHICVNSSVIYEVHCDKTEELFNKLIKIELRDYKINQALS